MYATLSESALRVRARRLGLRVEKSRTRNFEDHRYGRYLVADAETGCLVSPGRDYDLHLDDLADFLAWREQLLLA
jgi:hypothetical protein